MDFFSILSLIGGLALFLYGMDVMGDGLKKLSGSKLESLLGKLTANKFKGFLLGFAVTAVIQSSSATTVMLVGFVNSGIMRLSQTISTIMGANVGTTVTAWLLSTSGISGESFIIKLLKPDAWTPILAAVGAGIIMFSTSDRQKNLASIFLGFAVLMFGMDSMSGAVSGLKDNPEFAKILVMFENPILGVLAGAIFTAIIQSSSASVGILQALSATGTISYAVAIPIILGQNIGTTITPIISSINANKESKRVAFICLLFNVIGTVVWASIFYAINYFVTIPVMKEGMYVNAVNIAVIHTLFNILTSLLLLPFTQQLERLAVLVIKGKKDTQEIYDPFATLDGRFFTVPSFAVEKCRELAYEMAQIANESVVSSTKLLNNYNRETEENIAKQEARVDKYEDKISAYLVDLSEKNLNTADSHQVTKILHIIGDVERISDHALNICETAEEMHEKKISFSDEATKEISVLTDAVREILSITTDMLEHDDIEMAKRVEPLEQIIDKLKKKIKNNHVKRLQVGECTVELGFILSDLLTNYERIADHCSNIAVAVLGNAKGNFEAHDYMSHVKNEGENDFFEKYDYYKKKYSI